MSPDHPPTDHRPPEHPHPALSRVADPLPPDVGRLIVREPTPAEDVRHRAAVDSSFGLPFKPHKPDGEARFDALAPRRNRRVVLEQLPDGTERIIGGALSYDSELSLPGGRKVPVAALSGVGVEPGAGGRGAMRALVEEHLQECRARGDAASVLMASQTPLYPRFGYGCSVETANWEIDAHAGGLIRDAPTSGRVHVEVARGQALHEALDAIWRAAASARAGELSRNPAWWNLVLAPEESWMGGGAVMVALHSAGTGYVLYTADIAHGRQGLSEADIQIKELIAVDVAAELDLWRYIVALPWARRIRWNYAQIDPAARHWLVDFRQLRRMSHFDFLWVRPLDMPALVASRSFAADGTVPLHVTDPVFPGLGGRFDLRVEHGAGSWEPSGGDAALQVTAADLGALWLGGAAARELLAVRRISGDPRAARLLDAMLATDGPPRCVTKF